MPDVIDFNVAVSRIGETRYEAAGEVVAGERVATEFGLSYTGPEWREFVTAALQRPREIGDGAPDAARRTGELERLREFGGELYAGLFSGAVRGQYLERLARARSEGATLRVALRLDGEGTDELPWEYLYQSGHEFLALLPEVSVVRYAPAADASGDALLDTPEPLRVLVLVAAPRGGGDLDVEREWRELVGALRDLRHRHQVVLERLEPPTLEALATRLHGAARAPFHVFHFIGHGAVGPRGGALLFEDGSGGGVEVGADDLGDRLRRDRDHRDFRLAVVNACESARAAPAEPLRSVARALTTRGVPGVVGMQSKVSDPVAIAFASAFYRALAAGKTAERALFEGRETVYAQGEPLEWGTPVLYTSRTRPISFEFRSLRPDEKEGLLAAYLTEIDGMRGRPERMRRDEGWSELEDRLRAVAHLDPGNERARRDLREVEHIRTQYRRGVQAFEEGRHEQARRYFVETLDYGDSAAYLGRLAASPPERSAAPDAPSPSSSSPAASDALEEHFEQVKDAFVNGQMALFLGPDVHLSGRPSDAPAWDPHTNRFPPSRRELAGYLASEIGDPSERRSDPSLAAQAFVLKKKEGPLRTKLMEIYRKGYSPSPLHEFYVNLPKALDAKGYGFGSVAYPVTISTNLDDVLTSTYERAGEPYDLLRARVRSGHPEGLAFEHLHFDGAERHDRGTVDLPDQYVAVDPDRRPVVVKVCGMIDRAGTRNETFILTEDHFLTSLTRTNLAEKLPINVQNRLRESYFLLLGNSLQDWTFRHVLLQLLPERVEYPRWLVQQDASDGLGSLWASYPIEILDYHLDDYLAEFVAFVNALPQAGTK